MTAQEPLTYAAAGVDIHAGDLAVELMKSAVAKTHDERVIGGFGGFSGLFDASELLKYRRPLLASSTDGVGTKVAIAQRMDVHDTIGQDLVAMVVDDIVVSGAKPLAMTDYIATGKVYPERIADIVRGIAEGCQLAGCALVGGETAEHPDLLGPNDYDVAGAAFGVVEADEVLGAHRVQDGDVVLAMAASGLHSNGYSLVRRIIARAEWQLDRDVTAFGRTLGEELLEPTRIYSAACLELTQTTGIHAFSHVTGGGLAANLARVLPQDLSALVTRDAWELPAVFQVMQDLGQVPWNDLEATLNMGVGMIAVLPADQVDQATGVLAAHDIDAWTIGEVFTAAAATARAEGLKNLTWTQNAKGVDGGAVGMYSSYRLS